MTQNNAPGNPSPDPADPQPPAAPTPAKNVPAPKPAAKPRRRWLRRTLIAVGVLIVIVVVIIGLLPTLLSTGAARGFAVNTINENLNGHVEINSWSFSWTGGIRVEGVKVFDDSKRQILEIGRISSDLSLIQAAKGNIHLGKTVVDGLDFFAELNPDQSLNFSKLAKSKKSTESSPSDKASTPSKLPNIDGQIELTNSRGTFQTDSIDKVTQQQKSDSIKFTSIKGTFKIPNINEQITDDLEVVASVNGTQSGTVTVDGTLNVVRNNAVVALDQMNVLQNVNLSGDLASALGFLPVDLSTFAGTVKGGITIDLDAGHAATLNANVAINHLKVGGAVIKGDTYAADSISIEVPTSTIDMSPSLGGSDNYRLRIGGESKAPITIVIKNTVDGKPSESKITFAADTTPGLLKNVAANKVPGADGMVHATVDLDLTPIVRTLPDLLSVLPDKRVRTGRFRETTDIKMSASQTLVDQSVIISDITADDLTTHRKIEIEPFKFAVKSTDLGGGGKIPDLRDILVSLTTRVSSTDKTPGFANIDVSGKTLADVAAKVHINLNDFVKEYGQLFDFGQVELAGTVDVSAGSKGDLIGDSQPLKPSQNLTADASINVTAKDLVVSGLLKSNRPPLAEPNLVFTTTATLERGATEFISGLKNIHTTVKTGNLDVPTLDVDLGASISMKTVPVPNKPNATEMQLAAADVKINRISVNPTQLQAEFGAFLPLADDQLNFRSGMLNIDGAAQWDGKNGNVKVNVKADKLQLDKAKGASFEKVLDNYTMTTVLAAELISDAAGGSQITVSQFQISDDQTNIGIQNADGKPIKIITSADEKMQGSGSLHIDRLNLAWLMRLAKAFSVPTPVVAGAPPAPPEGQVAAGTGSGSIDLSSTPKGEMQVDGHLGLAGISYSVPNAIGLTNEDVKVELTAIAGQGFKSVALQKCHVTTSVLTADATAAMRLEGDRTFDKVRAVTVHVEIPSFALVQQKIDAITPPPTPAVTGKPIDGTASASSDRASLYYALAAAKPAPAKTTAVGPTPPTKLSAGSAIVNLTIGRDAADHLIITPDVQGKDIELTKDGIKDPIGLVVVKGLITLLTDAAPTTAPSTIATPTTLPSAIAAIIPSTQATTQPTTQPSALDEITAIQLNGVAVYGIGGNVILNGSIEDPMHARRINNLTLDLFYNGGMLWNAILPMMPKATQAKFKDAKVGGNYGKKFTINGAYPADQDMNQAIVNLDLHGEIQLDLFEDDSQGVTLKNFILPMSIEHGVAHINKPDKQDFTAELNTGHLNLHGIAVDLHDPHMLVNIPAGTKLFDAVSLNSILTANIGDYVNNPLFVGADEASGSMTITVNKCENLPTDDLLTQAVSANQGVLDMDLPITKFEVGNDNIQKVSDGLAKLPLFGHKGVPVKDIQGAVSTFHVHIEHGVTDQNMVIDVTESKRPIKLYGTVNMATKMINMTFEFPFASMSAKLPKQFQSIIGDGAKVVLSGPVSNPTFDLGSILQKNLSGDLVKGLLGGGNNTGDTTQPSSGSDDPLKDLINGIGKKKKK